MGCGELNGPAQGARNWSERVGHVWESYPDYGVTAPRVKKHPHGRVTLHRVREAKQSEESFHAEQGLAGATEVGLHTGEVIK